jgi:hypothetical protein
MFPLLLAYVVKARGSFTKQNEVTIKFASDAMDDMLARKPRLIQPMSDEYNVIVGPVAFSLSVVCSQVLNGLPESPIFWATKGTAESYGAWAAQLRGTPGVWVPSDLSRCDTTMRRHTQRLLQSCFSYVAPKSGIGGPEFASAMNLLFSSSRTSGRTKHGLYYSAPAQCESGKPTTSLGNTVVFGLLWWSVLEAVGIYGQKMIIGGDDGLTFIPFAAGHPDRACVENKLRRAEKMMCSIGLLLEWSVQTELHMASFFSGHFLDSADCLLWSPKVGRCLAKSMMYRCEGQRARSDKLSAWVAEVAEGNRNTWNHMPVLGVLRERLASLAGPPRPYRGSVFVNPRIHAAQPHDSCDLTYLQVAEIYGVTPADLRSLEDHIRTMPRLGYVTDNSVALLMGRLDAGDDRDPA